MRLNRRENACATTLAIQRCQKKNRYFSVTSTPSSRAKNFLQAVRRRPRRFRRSAFGLQSDGGKTAFLGGALQLVQHAGPIQQQQPLFVHCNEQNRALGLVFRQADVCGGGWVHRRTLESGEKLVPRLRVAARRGGRRLSRLCRGGRDWLLGYGFRRRRLGNGPSGGSGRENRRLEGGDRPPTQLEQTDFRVRPADGAAGQPG
jgi:hypothetical protein